MSKVRIFEGRDLMPSDKKVAVMGYSAAYEMFDKRISLNKKIIIGNEEFKVVGIREKYGGVMGETEDMTIFIPIGSMRKYLGVPENKISLIIIEKDPTFSSEEISERINDVLCKKRKSCGNEDFYIITPEFVHQTVSQISHLTSSMLGSIASISLIVGSIGIANTMYTSVLERTREIGILKAIGASSKYIMLMFLLESGIIGLIGGLVGLLLGYGLGEGFLLLRYYSARSFASEFSVTPTLTHMSFSPLLFVGALLLSFLVGILSGIFPARRAAKLNPVEALRYE